MFWLVTVSCSKFSRELSLKVNDIMSSVSPVSKCGRSATKKRKCDQLQSARVARKNCSEPASESGGGFEFVHAVSVRGSTFRYTIVWK